MANTPTTYYAINKPASGDTGWGTTMNADMDIIDTALQGMAQRAGRAGGQTLYGGTAASNSLTLAGTSHGTPGYVLLQPTAGNVGVGPLASYPWARLSIAGGSDTIPALGIGNDTWGWNLYERVADGDLLLKANNSAETTVLTLKRSNGNVGIGTATPAVPLQVSGTGSYGVVSSIVGTAANGAFLHFTDNSLGNWSIGQNPTTASFGLYLNKQPVAAGTAIVTVLNTGFVGIGIQSPASLLHANLADAGTNAVVTVLTIGHNSSDTPAAGFGSRVSWLLNSSTTDDQLAAALDVAWRIGTHATRTSWVNLQVVNSGTLTRWLHNYADATADGYNAFLGLNAGNTTLTPAGGASSLASFNNGFGTFALIALTTGFNDTAMGHAAGGNLTTGYNNTIYGASALLTCTTGYGDVAIGYGAGYYETGSNKLFIDNATRASEADGRAKALIYGIFDAAVANQEITFNVGKHGFFGQAAVAKPTGVAVTAAAIHAALVTLNLIAA